MISLKRFSHCFDVVCHSFFLARGARKLNRPAAQINQFLYVRDSARGTLGGIGTVECLRPRTLESQGKKRQGLLSH